MDKICFCFFFSFLLSSLTSLSWGKLVQDEITGRTTLNLSLKEACELQGKKDSVLVDQVDRETLDCMGRKINVTESCLKKREDHFLKAYVLEGKVFCEYGRQVILSIECDERDQKYCSSSKKSCEGLQKKFALKLELFRDAVVTQDDKKILNCYFDDSKK